MRETYLRLCGALVLVAGASLAADAQHSADKASREQEAATPLFPDGTKPSDTEKDRRDGIALGQFKLDAGATLTQTSILSRAEPPTTTTSAPSTTTALQRGVR